MIELNKVMLVGRLTRDPETRYTPSGAAVANFSIAVNRWRGRDQEPEVLFIDCEAWAKTAEFIQQWFQKGKAIFIEGRLRMDRWQDRDSGQNRSKLLVVAERASFVGGKDDGEGNSDDSGGGGGGGNRREAPAPSRGASGGAPRGGGSAGGGASRRPPASVREDSGSGNYSADYGSDDGPTDDDLPF